METEKIKRVPINGKKGEGLFALVDDFNFEELSKKSWCLQRGYACTWFVKTDGKRTLKPMHYFLLEAKEGYVIDHKDRVKLNNTMPNLRYATKTENARNKPKSANKKSSIYLGVFLRALKRRVYLADGSSYVTNRKTIKYISKIMVNRKNIIIGSFDTEESAAIAYNVFAEKYFGEFACLNTVPQCQ